MREIDLWETMEWSLVLLALESVHEELKFWDVFKDNERQRVLKVVLFRMSSALWPIRAERHACMVILGEILNPTCVSSILSVYAIIPMILNIYFCFIIELRQRRMFACKYGCIWLNQRWSVYRSKSGKWTHSKRRGASKVYTTKRASTNTTTTTTTPTTSNYAR